MQGCAVSAVVAGGAASGFMLRSERDIPEQPAPQLLERLQVPHPLPYRSPPPFFFSLIRPACTNILRTLEVHVTSCSICGRAIRLKIDHVVLDLPTRNMQSPFASLTSGSTTAVIALLRMQAAVAAASLDASGVAPEAATGAAQHLITAIDNVFGCAAAISAAFGNRVRPAILSSTASLLCGAA